MARRLVSAKRLQACVIRSIEAGGGAGLREIARFCGHSEPEIKTVARNLMSKGAITVKRGGMYDNRQPWFRLAPGWKYDSDRQVYSFPNGSRVDVKIRRRGR